MRKKVWLFALAAVLLVILAGCRGNKLPDGMDEDKVARAGLPRDVAVDEGRI